MELHVLLQLLQDLERGGPRLAVLLCLQGLPLGKQQGLAGGVPGTEVLSQKVLVLIVWNTKTLYLAVFSSLVSPVCLRNLLWIVLLRPVWTVAGSNTRFLLWILFYIITK